MRALRLVDRPVTGCGDQGPGRVECPCMHVGEGGIERPPNPPRWIGRQFGRSRKKGGGSSDSSASLGPPGRVLELGSDFLVGPGRGSGAMPGAPVRILLGVRGLGKRQMYSPPVLGSGRTVSGGPDEWMRELHVPTHIEQPGVHRREGGSHIDVEHLGGTMEQYWVTDRLRRRREREQLRVRGKLSKTPDITLLDLACY